MGALSETPPGSSEDLPAPCRCGWPPLSSATLAVPHPPGSSYVFPVLHAKGRGVDESADVKGTKTLGLSAAANVIRFLGDPFAAGVIGVALGAGLHALTAAGVRCFTPETLEVGMARAVAMLVLGLVLAFAGLLAYYLFVRPGLVAFGLGLAGGFIVPATIALFRMPGLSKPTT